MTTTFIEADLPGADNQLLARCRAGDTEAFAEIYDRYERTVFRCAYHLLGHYEDAIDIRQETFVRAFLSLADFREDCALLTWLLKICRNLCRDRARSWERRHAALDDLDQEFENQRASPLPDPATVLVQSESARLVRRALLGMPHAHREVLVLRDVEGLEFGEVANMLGCSRAVLSVRLFRARRMLRERVEALWQARE